MPAAELAGKAGVRGSLTLYQVGRPRRRSVQRQEGAGDQRGDKGRCIAFSVGVIKKWLK